MKTNEIWNGIIDWNESTNYKWYTQDDNKEHVSFKLYNDSAFMAGSFLFL